MCAGDGAGGVDGQEVRGSSWVHLVLRDAEFAGVDFLVVAVAGVGLVAGELVVGKGLQVDVEVDVVVVVGELLFRSQAEAGVGEVGDFVDFVLLAALESEIGVVVVAAGAARLVVVELVDYM